MSLVEDFAPLTARRSLGALDAAKLEELELASPSASLGVVRRGREVELALGGETFGTRHRYAAHEGQVFVLGNTLVRPLSQAKTRLVERKLVGWEESELESIQLQLPDGPVVLEQANRDDREESYWAAAGSVGEDEEASDWVDRLLRLRARTYLEEEPGELVPILTARLQSGSEAVLVELFDGPPAPQTAADNNPSANPLSATYARTSFTRGLVRLQGNSGQEVADDAAGLAQD